MYYLEDFEVGMTLKSKARYKVTEKEIIDVGLRWDPRPFHTDVETASNSIFGGIVACSAHLFGIMSWLGHQIGEPTAAVSALGFDKIRLLAPVMAGDKISLKSTVLVVRLSNSRPGCGVICVNNELFNQRDELVYSIQVASMILCRASEAA